MARVPESYWEEYDKKKNDWFPKIIIAFIGVVSISFFVFALCMR